MRSGHAMLQCNECWGYMITLIAGGFHRSLFPDYILYTSNHPFRLPITFTIPYSCPDMFNTPMA